MAADGSEVEEAIQAALEEASAEGVEGRDVTPFVLKRVNERTEGKSLKANLGLVKNNAEVGAAIAVEVARSMQGTGGKAGLLLPKRRKRKAGRSDKAVHSLDQRPLVIGGSNFDLVTTVRDPIKLDGSTHRGRVELSLGGVGRNVADALARFGADPYFVSAVGDDDLGERLIEHNALLDKTGVSVLTDAETAVYSVLLDKDGEAAMGVGDMRIHRRIDPKAVDEALSGTGKPSVIVLDGNLTEEAIEHVLKTCADSRFE